MDEGRSAQEKEINRSKLKKQEVPPYKADGEKQKERERITRGMNFFIQTNF